MLRTITLLSALLLAACASQTAERKAKGAECELNSECADRLVCRLGRCRTECSRDRDCPLGTFCAADNSGVGTCLLPEESNCATDRDCPTSLMCASDVDRVCRRPCTEASGGCLGSQGCVASFCVDLGVSDVDGGADGGLDSSSPGPCLADRADCNDDPSDGCEADLTSDIEHCGMCTRACRDSAAHAVPTCMASACGLACEAGFDDCNGEPEDGCEAATARDEENCGACGRSCGADRVCVEGACRASAFPTTSSEVLEPAMGDAELGPLDGGTRPPMHLHAGRHEYASIHIPRGYVLQLAPEDVGTGVLELIASGDVIIEGTIDLTGGAGGNITVVGSSPGGGTTGAPIAGRSVRGCNDPGPGGSGGAGQRGPGAASGCAEGGRFGGGMGGYATAGGGGGGGYSGGGGGGSATGPGGGGGSIGTDVGGMGGAMCEGGLGGVAPSVYAGGTGVASPDCALPGCGGGGGGSIGAIAASDLAVGERTFRSGSGGGGGGANAGGTGGTGGGGGGGAIRIASGTRLVISGSVLANGGAGGSLGPCGGGGGSGGVIYLAAPELEITSTARVEVDGGGGGPIDDHEGGAGGLGRVRVSTDPNACRLEGSFGNLVPPLDCEPTPEPQAGHVYIGVYPN